MYAGMMLESIKGVACVYYHIDGKKCDARGTVLFWGRRFDICCKVKNRIITATDNRTKKKDYLP
jgi:hypothetical protein